MPIYDASMKAATGIPLTKKDKLYSNLIGPDGNVLTPDLTKVSLRYDELFAIMRHQNMIETFERYQWINIPFGLSADLIERVLYFRGKGILYFNDKIEKFQFLPFALNGQIDEYGRYLRCNTLPFTGVTDNPEDKKHKQSYVYENLDIVYDLPYNKEMLAEIRAKKIKGIILNDNSLSISQQPVIRSNFVRPVLHMMATLMQIINSAMYGAADASLMTYENEAELESVQAQINAINQQILQGNRFIVVGSKIPLQPIKTSNTTDLEGLFGTFNSLTNFLKSITGVANAGVFDKKAHLLQEEQRLNGSNSDDIYYNGLRLRQEFCLMVQAYYGYPIWCSSKRAMSEEEAENLMLGEKTDPDNTQQVNGGYEDGKNGTSNETV